MTSDVVFQRKTPAKLIAFCLALGLLGPAVRAQGAGYWHTSGSRILDANGSAVRIAGVNWYGFETTDAIVHGLWAQDYKSILNGIKNQGYNTVRIPFSNQMVESNPVPSNLSFQGSSGPINTDLRGLTSLQILDKIVTYAGQIGLRIILDNHRSEAGNSAEDNGLWYTSAYPESKWIQDWVSLANRYAGNSTVIGFDLRNEPHSANGGGATWGTGDVNTDWRLAAQRAGNQILAVNPNLLIFVEGIQAYQNDWYWWGGNLEGAGQYPVQLNVANRVVYSAHDYGPHEYGQSWFNGSTTYSSLVSVWTKYWAYLALNNIAPVWVGEFGTPNANTDIQDSTPGSQGQWFQSMVQFLKANPQLNWTYWALNGEDSYALLDSNYDATPANPLKQQALASIQFPLSGGSGGGTPDFSVGATPGSQTVTAGSGASFTVSTSAFNGFAGTIGFSVTGLPAGANGTFQPTSVTGSGNSALSITTASSTAAGTYPLTITATSGSLSHTIGVSLTVNAVTQPSPDFTLTASPNSQTVTAGSATTYQVTTAAKNGFTGNVSLTVSGLPSGATANFSANPAAVGSPSNLSVSTASTTPAGTYTLTVKGTSGSLTHTAPVTLVVNPASTGGGGGCVVTWAVSNDWGSGFVTNLTVTNNTGAAINGWTLAWKFSGNQQITNLWNGTLTQSGQSITVKNMSYNASIPNGSNTQLGFQAAYSGTNQRPAAFTLNGVACTSN